MMAKLKQATGKLKFTTNNEKDTMPQMLQHDGDSGTNLLGGRVAGVVVGTFAYDGRLIESVREVEDLTAEEMREIFEE